MMAFLLLQPFNPKNIIKSISFFATLSMIALKYLTIYVNRNEISKMLIVLRQDYLGSQMENLVKVQEHFNMPIYLKKFRKFYRVYASALPIAGFFPNVLALLKLIFKHERTFNPGLYLPFDATRIEIYPFVLAWNLWAIFATEFINVANVVLVFGILTYISMQFDVLSENFRDLKDETDATIIREKVHEHTKRHIVLLQLAAQLDVFFSISFFYNFVVSSMVICCTLFQASIATDIEDFIFNATYCAAVLFAMYIQCFFGQMLKNASSKIVDSVFDCGWEKIYDLKVRRQLLMVLLRAQKPIAITIWRFAEVTIEQFGEVSTFFNFLF